MIYTAAYTSATDGSGTQNDLDFEADIYEPGMHYLEIFGFSDKADTPSKW